MFQVVAHYKNLWRLLAIALNKGASFRPSALVPESTGERAYSAKEKTTMEKEICQLASVLISKGALSLSSGE